MIFLFIYHVETYLQLNICHVETLLHMTICHMEKFLHMTDFFSTSTAGGDGDKYQVCMNLSFELNSKSKYVIFFLYSVVIYFKSYVSFRNLLVSGVDLCNVKVAFPGDEEGLKREDLL